jgi:outer membrane protein
MMLISKGHFRRSTALLIVAASAAAGTAQAQTPAQTQAQAQSQNQDHIVLGVGVAATPAYQGSDETRVIPIPAIDIREGWFFANLRNGVGVVPISTEHFEIGASAVFVQGYRGKDVPDGIDKLSDGVGARLFTNIRAGGFVATLGAVKIVSGGTKGMVADASISYPINISSRFMLTPTVGTTWADRKYNDRYFGVTPTESLASGLPEFGMGGGFKDVSGMLTASYRLTDRITLSATGGVTSMIGDAADSPLVEKKTQPSGIFTLTYRL